MLHRVTGGGPVSHVFLSRECARSFLSRFLPSAAVPVDDSLPHVAPEHEQAPNIDVCNVARSSATLLGQPE